MINSSLQFRLGQISDLEEINLLFLNTKKSLREAHTTMWSQDGYPLLEDFLNDIKEGRLYVLDDEEGIEASLSFSFDILEEFFPSTHDEAALKQLLATMKIKPEGPFLLLHRLMVNPLKRKQGLGRLICQNLLALYPHYTALALTSPDNVGARLFYTKNHWSEGPTYKFDYDCDPLNVIYYRYIN